MKRIIVILLLSLGVYTTTSAQTTSAQPSSSVSKQKNKANKEAIAAQKKTDKQAKALTKKQAKEQAKENKESTIQPSSQVQTTSTPATASVTKVKRQKTVVSHANTAHPADKVISTDTKGRTIYQGPKGGKYYIDKNGNKEYVK